MAWPGLCRLSMVNVIGISSDGHKHCVMEVKISYPNVCCILREAEVVLLILRYCVCKGGGFARLSTDTNQSFSREIRLCIVIVTPIRFQLFPLPIPPEEHFASGAEQYVCRGPTQGVSIWGLLSECEVVRSALGP